MKKLMLLCTLFLTCSLLRAQSNTWQDAVLGGWINGDGDAKIEIYKSGNKYYGKITWLREPFEDDGVTPKVDDENPDESKQSQPIMGLVILKNFEFKDGYWQGGTIYDPKNGKTYKCEFWFGDNKTELRLRGYWGFVYRTETWTRPK